MPIRVTELDLYDELQPVGGGVGGYNSLRILVRVDGRPVGWVTVENMGQSQVSPERLENAIADQLGGEFLTLKMRGIIGDPGMDRPKTPPPISIVICTRDRTDLLEGCVRALLALDYPQYEVLVVDNAPSSEATANLVSTLPARYIREDLPGLNRARNAGIAQARYEIVAFIDDDARPDRGWLSAIASAFEDPQVMAVSGFVAPVELETEAQILFEIAYGGMGHGFQTRVLSRESLSKDQLLWASNFGVGANMAFRGEVFESIGLFDPALDVGTPSGGGGDVEIFHRLVASGHTLVYEPSVLVWHQHRQEMAALRRLVFNNGRSFGAYLLTVWRKRTVGGLAILNFAIRKWLLGWLIYRLFEAGKFPRSLVIVELLGAVLSPVAYYIAQARARKLDHKAGSGGQVILPVPD
jgi:glycosyltransferase involved in cell wall biosynthesis